MRGPGAPILIDGTHGEGGGALLRTALAMSALTQQAVRLNDVRGGTTHPGLDIEDLVTLRALATSCAAEVVGVELGSHSFSFLPTRRARGLNGPLDLTERNANGRLPNVNVVLNSLLPVLARTGMYSRVSLKGETYGANVLGYDYFANVTLTALAKMGLCAFPDQELAGFGRQSPGEVVLDIEPSELNGLQWASRGKLVGCHAIVAYSELSSAIAQRAAAHLRNLAMAAKLPMEQDVVAVDSHTPGFFVTVWAEYENGIGGGAAMGAKGVRAENTAQKAFDAMLQWTTTDASVDAHLADQILIPLSLVVAEGGTTLKTSELTKRFLTSVWVLKQFLPIHITVKGTEGLPGTVSIRR